MCYILVIFSQVPLLSWDGVMPANDPDVDLEVERLNGRPKGIIKVHVIQAKDLKAYDTIGKCVYVCLNAVCFVCSMSFGGTLCCCTCP
jgi:hypothetical protein